MARFRVKAYFMHENEEAAARQAETDALIETPEWTDGYVMGVVDEPTIASLTEQGLIVTPVEQLADPAPVSAASDVLPADEIPTLSGMIFTRVRGATASSITRPAAVPLSLPETAPKKKLISCDRKRPQFYLVRFHGPLVDNRATQLKKLRIKPLERVSRNKYTVRLEPGQLENFAALDFVDWIRLYDSVDTLRSPVSPPEPQSVAPSFDLTPLGAPSPAGLEAMPAPQVERSSPPRTSVHAIRLHRAQDMRTLLAWLKKHKRKPLWKGKDSLRVALPTPGKELTALSKLPEVAIVEELRPARLFDQFARELLGLLPFHDPGPGAAAAATGLRGTGELIGIADTGIDKTHPDFQGRISKAVALGRPPSNTTDPEGHGTHVAGCAAGDGSASSGTVMGAAPAAKVYFQSILDSGGTLGGLPEDLTKLFQQAYTEGVRIHNNSWGAFAFARYSTTSQHVDRFVADNPDMLIVIAAGNDGIAVPRAINATMTADKGFVDWPSVAAPATAKNGLTVGASRSSRKEGGLAAITWGDAWSDRYPEAPIGTQTISGNHNALAAFSSRGPCDDQRIKPDVVAPGTDIAAARSKDAPLRKFWGAYPDNDKYAFMGGTSMAAPYVTGCAALVREWYRKRVSHPKPSAALLKATLINGTRRLIGKDAQAALEGDPNYHQGFGRIDMPNTLPNTSNPKLKLVFNDTWTKAARAFTSTGQRARYTVQVAAGTPLRICLTWTDPPARSLQNSLVLLVDNGTQNKWIGNLKAATLLKIAGGVPDPNNNVQVVRIEKPAAGTYTLAITATNLLLPPQHYALVVTGDLKSALVPA